eukprot:536063-Rhodomonas_salina.2
MEECCAEQRLRDVREQALLVMKWGCGEVGDGRTEQSAAGKEREDSSQKNACGGQRALCGGSGRPEAGGKPPGRCEQGGTASRRKPPEDRRAGRRLGERQGERDAARQGAQYSVPRPHGVGGKRVRNDVMGCAGAEGTHGRE